MKNLTKLWVLPMLCLSLNLSAQWVQVGADIDGESAGDAFGVACALTSNGQRIAIGANLHDFPSTDAGHVKIYENRNGTWVQIGSTINGQINRIAFGTSVSFSADGKRLAIGSEKKLCAGL